MYAASVYMVIFRDAVCMEQFCRVLAPSHTIYQQAMEGLKLRENDRI